MADVITGNTELGTTKQTLIANLVQKELAFNAKLVQFITDVSNFAVPGSKQINFPKLTSFTVVNRVEAAAGEATALTASVDSLLLDQNAYVSWIIDAFTAKQSNIEPIMRFAQRAAAAQARYVDERIIATIRSGCSLFLNVGADVDVTYANVLSMAKELEENDGDLSKAAWMVSPQQKYALMALSEFKSADVFGQATLPSGVIGTILGMPIVAHNGLAGKEMFLVEKDGLGIGFQKNAEYGEQDEIEYGVGAKRAAIDQYFGTLVMQQGQKGAAAGKSPLIIGLND
jgi:hypothetical protein